MFVNSVPIAEAPSEADVEGGRVVERRQGKVAKYFICRLKKNQNICRHTFFVGLSTRVLENMSKLKIFKPGKELLYTFHNRFHESVTLFLHNKIRFFDEKKNI